MPVSVMVFRPEAAPERHVAVDRVSRLAADGEGLVWIDVENPSAAELTALGQELDLPEFALEDAVEAHQRPKADRYPGVLFLTVYGASLDAGEVILSELGIFVLRHALVVVRHAPPYGVVRAPERLQTAEAPSSAYAAYALLDEVVDGYGPISDAIADRVEELEDGLLVEGGDPTALLAESLDLKRHVLQLRRVVRPLRDVLVVLARADTPVIREELDDEFRDLVDHLTHVAEDLDVTRELLDGILNAYLGVVSNRLNRSVLRLSGWAAIVVVPTLIASVYGMNFDRMPELHWRLGYAWALGLMVASVVGLWVVFRRRGLL